VTSFPENLRGHVAWSSACCRQNVELLLVHDSGESEICDEQIGIVFWGSEEQILGFQITMNDSMIVKIGDGGKGGSDQVGGVRLIVVSFAANAVEEFTTKREIGYEVDWGVRLARCTPVCSWHRTIVHGLEVVHQGQNITVTHRHLLQNRDLISDLSLRC
jgi:hypothetical protein